MKEEEAIGFLFSPLTFPDLPSSPARGVCEREKYGNSVYAMYTYDVVGKRGSIAADNKYPSSPPFDTSRRKRKNIATCMHRNQIRGKGKEDIFFQKKIISAAICFPIYL